ncbi:MAG TPA: hypothetical protein VGF46_01835 [Gaiellales bacterium]|jgi:hypothetical protein
MRKALIILVALAALIGVSASNALACSSGAQAIPSSYLQLYKSWGAVTGVPWSLLAAVGSVESDHGLNPAAFVPHTRGVLGPMQFQAGSNKLARKQDSYGDQGFGGTWALWRTASGHPPYRMDDPDDEIAAAAAKLHNDAGPDDDWAQALYHYNALGAYVNLVLKRARQYRLGTCAPSSSTTLDPPSSTTDTSSPTVSSASAAGLLASSSIELTGAAAGDLRRGIVDSRLISLLGWISQTHSVAISEFKTGHGKYVAGTSKISNNWYGRAVTITAVDGLAVSPGSSGAHALWQALRTAPSAIRPSEIGAPWADPSNPRYYSGSDALNVIHIGFDGPTQH